MTDPVLEWVEVSCSAQGLAVKIADSTVLTAVAELLGARQVPSSDAPHRGEAQRVKAVVSASAGADDDVIEDGADNALLSRERQVIPPVAQRRSVPNMVEQDGRAAYCSEAPLRGGQSSLDGSASG